MTDASTEICIIGLGPRGLSVMERLCANAPDLLAPGERLRVHIVDPQLRRGSSVWRTGQSPELLMNTVSSQVTMFVDDSVACEGPTMPGPSLYEWAQSFVRGNGELPAHVRGEAERLRPDDYPSRAFYGRYLTWVLEHLRATAPSCVSITPHHSVAEDVDDEPDGRQFVSLADGTRLSGLDSVVLTQGHTPTRPTDTELRLAQYAGDEDLAYLPPANPADADLTALHPGRPTLLRGMGLNFFDYLALLTSGRGGRFERQDDGRLRYHPSGQEPKLIAGSRRGVPHHARGENQKGAAGRHEPLFFTAQVVDELRENAEQGRPGDFKADIWPVVDREVRAVYYSTLIADLRGRPAAADFLRRYVACQADPDQSGGRRLDPDGHPFAYRESPGEAALLDRFGVLRSSWWDWNRISRPYAGREFANSIEFEAWLLAYLDADIREARHGNVDGALKAALDVLRDLRNEIRLVVDHGVLSGDSYRDDLQRWYTPFNAFVSIGPPESRIEEMAALIRAKALTVVGPGMTVSCPEDGEGFLIRSALVPDSTCRASALVEARLPESDNRRTDDPLLRHLLAEGRSALHRIRIRGDGYYETGGLAVTERPYRMLDAERRPHPRRFAFGVPTETVHWVTAAGIRPGVNSVILGDADAVARASLNTRAAAGDPVLSRH